MSEPTTEAGRALLRSDFDTTGWGPRLVREHVTKAILAIEAEARTDALDVAALQQALGEAIELLKLRPSGHTGPLDERIPWFTHGGVSHGADRPDCMTCQWLLSARAILAARKP